MKCHELFTKCCEPFANIRECTAKFLCKVLYMQYIVLSISLILILQLHYEIFMYVASEKPTARELSVYIKPHAQQWFEIGLLLDIKVQTLEEIEEHHRNDVQSCGARMLMGWLVSDPNACWKKLWDAVENVSKSTNIKASTESGTKCTCNLSIRSLGRCSNSAGSIGLACQPVIHPHPDIGLIHCLAVLLEGLRVPPVQLRQPKIVCILK